MSKDKPDPEKPVKVMDSIDLDALASRVSGYYNMSLPDRYTMSLANEINRTFDRMFNFMNGRTNNLEYRPQHSIWLSEVTGLNAGVIEAIRRGFFPFREISREVETRITNALVQVNRLLDNPS